MVEADLSTSVPGSSVTIWNQREAASSMEEHVFDEEIISLVAQKMNTYHQYLSSNPGVARSPSPPPFLLIPQQLLFCIRAYNEGSFQSGAWIVDELGGCISASLSRDESIEADNTLSCFWNLIVLAVDVANQGSYVRLRRALSRAFAVVEPLLKIGGPGTLIDLLQTICFLGSQGQPYVHVAKMLRTHIKEVARGFIHNNSPWKQICILLGELDEDTLQPALIQCHRSVSDQFADGLGPLNFTAICTRLSFINEGYRNDLPQSERLLRELLAQCEQSSSATSRVLNVMNHLAENLTMQKRNEEAEEVAREMLFRGEEAGNRVMEIKATELLAWSQYHEDNQQEAEESIRDAIDIGIVTYSEGSPYVIYLMGHLEGWLREWGRAEEADELQAKIDDLLGMDDIDEEAEREQSQAH